MDLMVMYLSGNCEFITPSNLGTDYGEGCIIEKCFLHVDDMYEKGIRLSVYYKPAFRDADEEAVVNEHVIVQAEDVRRVYKIEDRLRTLMIRDDSGSLLNPVETEQLMLEMQAAS